MRVFPWAVAVLALATACNLINPPEPLPAYVQLQVPRLQLRNGQSLQQAGSVPMLWVFQGGQLLGVVQSGNTLPTANLQDRRFVVQGGIFVNGSTDLHEGYSIWVADTLDVPLLTERDTVVLQPALRYQPEEEVFYAYEEGFEAPSFALEPVPVGSGGRNLASLVRTGTNPYAGSHCLEVKLNAQDTVVDLWTSPDLFLPFDRPVWAELSYRGTIKPGVSVMSYDLSLGVTIRDATLHIPTQPAQTDAWQKLVFDLAPFIDRRIDQTSPVRLSLVVLGDKQVRSLFLDDLRICYFK